MRRYQSNEIFQFDDNDDLTNKAMHKLEKNDYKIIANNRIDYVLWELYPYSRRP